MVVNSFTSSLNIIRYSRSKLCDFSPKVDPTSHRVLGSCSEVFFIRSWLTIYCKRIMLRSGFGGNHNRGFCWSRMEVYTQIMLKVLGHYFVLLFDEL